MLHTVRYNLTETLRRSCAVDAVDAVEPQRTASRVQNQIDPISTAESQVYVLVAAVSAIEADQYGTISKYRT